MIESSKGNVRGQILKYGMIGGGGGSFIGDVHRKAAAFDGKCQLMAGCFSRSYENTLSTGINLILDQDRLYKSIQEMAIQEGKREDKLDFVAIVTPNYAHYEAAKAFLQQGINVVCEKPIVFTVEEAVELKQLAKDKGLLFCSFYAYSGNPMVKQARKLVQDGKIGDIIMVMGEYAQDWLIEPLETEGQKQAAWRTDPAASGISNCIGDIGSHIEHTVSYITGLKIDSLCAKLDIIGKGRTLDTNGSILLKYTNGASGVYWASQVAIGNDNGLKVRIFGTKGSIEWVQEDGNNLRVTYLGQPIQLLSRGHGYLDAVAAARTPSGHQEGYYEAFANVYKKFATALINKKEGLLLNNEEMDFPDAEAGIDGVKFIVNSVKSSNLGAVWVKY
jgi:predicted dehydrogenase